MSTYQYKSDMGKLLQCYLKEKIITGVCVNLKLPHCFS